MKISPVIPFQRIPGVRSASSGLRFCALGIVAVFSGTAISQDYPTARTLRILTSQSGSGSDITARILAERLPESFGQRAVVDNRGILAPELAAKAAPDGYTLVIYSTPLWVSPLLFARPQWNTMRDFAPVTLAVNAPNLLAVHPSLPVKTVPELIKLAKARPGELNYGSGSVGSTAYLAAELFNAAAGVNIVRIPYKGVGPALLGLLSGQIQVLFPAAIAGIPYVKSGRLRALAVTSRMPSELLPGLPTVASFGFRDYEADTPLGVFLPAGTPAKIVNQLHKGLAGVLNTPEVKKLAIGQGSDVVASTPSEFTAWLKADIDRWAKLIQAKGLREER